MAVTILNIYFPYKGIARQHELCKEFVFMENEIWEDIVGYEGLYQVSNLGRVKSLSRDIPAKGLGYQRVNPEKVLKPGLYSNGYLFVVLCVNYKKSQQLIHRIVAKTFIENIELKPDVNHKDGNKKNNNENNLEWVTKKENTQHAIKLGLIDRRKPIVAFNDAGYMCKFSSIIEAAHQLGLKRTSINAVLKGSMSSSFGYKFNYV